MASSTFLAPNASARFADIIAVPGNPLENVRVLEDVRFVMKGGEIYRYQPLSESRR